MRWLWFRSSVVLVVLPGLLHPSTPGISIMSGRDGPIRGRRSRAGGSAANGLFMSVINPHS